MTQTPGLCGRFRCASRYLSQRCHHVDGEDLRSSISDPRSSFLDPRSSILDPPSSIPAACIRPTPEASTWSSMYVQSHVSLWADHQTMPMRVALIAQLHRASRVSGSNCTNQQISNQTTNPSTRP